METKSLGYDPILWNFELPLSAMYYPVGFPLEILTNSHGVLTAAEASWGKVPQHFDEPAARILVGVLEGRSTECPPPPVVRGRSHLITSAADPENFATCDLRAGYAFCWMTRVAVENTAYFRDHFLEAMGFTLVRYLYTTPLHAACVEFNGQGVLLCGNSGAGKSSLAFACAQRGWTFISDDATSIVRKQPGNRVIGNPRQMRLRESAMDLFPEFTGWPVTARGSGKPSIEIPTEDLPDMRTAWQTAIQHVVFLHRIGSTRPALKTIPGSEARKWFESELCYGEEEVREAQRSSLHQLLTTAEIHQLHYSDLDGAVDQLEAMVEQYAEPRPTPALL